MHRKRAPRHRSRRRISRAESLLFAWPLYAAGLALSSAFFLNSAQSSDLSKSRRFHDGLSIQIDRTSPAFAAMEDALLEDQLLESGPDLADTVSNQIADSTLVQFLQAGSDNALELAKKIVQDNLRERTLLAQAHTARELQAKALAESAAQVIQEVITSTDADTEEPQLFSKKKGRTLPTLLAAAQQGEAASKEPVKVTKITVSLSDLKRSRNELFRDLLLPIAATAGPASAGKLLAAHQKTPSEKRSVARKPSYRPAQHPSAFDHTTGDGSPSVLANASTPVGMNPGQESAASRSFVSDKNKENPGQLVIAGPIEFTGGIALTSARDRVSVFREVEGQVIEAGAVWLRDGRYEIFVDETEGHLVGELQTAQGDVLGRGYFDLSELPKIAPQQYKVDSVSLKIAPVLQGLSGRVLSAYSTKTKPIPVAKAEVEFENLPFQTTTKSDGHFEETHLIEGSTVLIRAYRLGHWGTLAFGLAGKKTEIELFPDKMMKAFTDLSQPGEDYKKITNPEEKSIIWGRVIKNGQPVAGAEVEIMTTQDEVKPVYFNSLMIPDFSLTATSANGLYAFFPVEPGSHAVQAKFKDVVTDPEIFPTEERSVSRVDLDIQLVKKARVRVFDAFRTDWPLQAKVSNPAMTRHLDAPRSGEALIRFASTASPLILDADTDPKYERVRVTNGRDRRTIYIPMIQSDWLAKIRNTIKINREPETGDVVGFFQGSEPYQVALDEESLHPNSKLLFFNSRGELTHKEFGEPGGGFILLNIPEGFRSVTVQPSGTEKIFSATILVESRVTNVLSHWIR